MKDVSALNQINMLLNDHLKDAPDAKSRENAARLIAAFTACRSFERQAHEAADVIDRLGHEITRLKAEVERLKAADGRPGKTIFQLVGEYSNALGRYGPDSPEVRRLREAGADDREFLEYADALDRVKRNLGGSGIDYPADAVLDEVVTNGQATS